MHRLTTQKRKCEIGRMKSLQLAKASSFGVPSFFPQSVSARHGDQPSVDSDTLTPMTTYTLQPHQRLEVGKYVPDPSNGKDPSGPKFAAASTTTVSGEERHTPASRSSLRSATGSRGSAQSLLTTSASSMIQGDDVDDVDFEDVETPVDDGDAARFEDVTTIRVTVPTSDGMVGAVFYPVHYPPLSSKDRSDARGTPQSINEDLHPNDRSALALTEVSVKGVNLNKMLLYKIGPGAVAFRVVINALEAGGMKYTPSNKYFNLLWAKRATPAMLSALHPYQKINHFPGTWGIGRKDSLATNVGRMRRQYGPSAYNIVPASFILPKEKEELAEDLRQATDETGAAPTYIVKPSASSCGRGIRLCKGMPSMPKGDKTYVCQRYIGNPFLVQQRKFDLRMYCVVTGFDPLKIYLFDEGLVRFAAEKYPGPDKGLENTYMHLTNYSVSKTAELKRESSGKSEDGDDPVDIKWCLTDFVRWLRTQHGEDRGNAMWAKIINEAHEVIVKMFLSIEAEVVTKMRSECSDPTGRNCFELYGLDLMVDSELNVKLIEVNIMPSLATGTTLDKAVKSRMLAHMLTLVGVVPVCRDAITSEALSQAAFFPRGAYVQGAAERYFYPTVRGAPRGTVERNNVPLLTRFNQPSVKESTLSALETLMLRESDEEMHRAGGFTRVFPTAANAVKYFPYFTQGVSRNNYLLASWMQMREKACS